MARENTTIIPANQNPIPIESSNLNNLPFSFKLNDTNFKIWSRMIEVHAAGLNKLGYLNGDTPKVGKNSSRYGKWCVEDAIV